MLYRHSIMPYFISATKSGLALAWKAGIAAEVLCTPDNSIGLMLHESKIYLEFPTLFAWTLTVVLFSFVFEKLLVYFAGLFLGKGRRKV
jgi:NitT/TauT family transport system permease protein